jgi:hypothetical protein
MLIEMKIDKLPFTYRDERINSDMSVRLKSIDDEYAIDGAWLWTTYDGHLDIIGSLAHPVTLTLELGYFPTDFRALLWE